MRDHTQKYNNHDEVAYEDILSRLPPTIWATIYEQYRECNKGKDLDGDTHRHLLAFFRESKEIQQDFCYTIKRKRISPSVHRFISGIEASIPFGLTDNQLKSILTTFNNVKDRQERAAA